MKHDFIDKHSDRRSLIHDLDPRIKVVCFMLFIISVNATPSSAYRSFGLDAVLVGFWLVLSRLPLGFVFKRSLTVVPFVILIGLFIPFLKQGSPAATWSWAGLRFSISREGLALFGGICIKAYLSILGLILLASSTRFTALLHALERLRLPKLFIMIISFMYRYAFVLQDELDQMKMAKEARTAGGSRRVHARVYAQMIGVLFLRAYERAELVYLAMSSRGFTGTFRTVDGSPIRARDVVFLAGTLTTIILIQGIGRFHV